MNFFWEFLKKYFTFILSFLVLVIIVLTLIFTSYILYNHTKDLLTENLRERLLTISRTQAANISSTDLDALQVESDWQKPEWARLVNSLHAAKYANDDVVFMYIFRYTKDPTDDPITMEFVADADSIYPYANTGTDTSKYVDVNRDGKVEPDGPDKLQWPGQPNHDTDSIPEAHEAFREPITVKELYSDNYGTVLTGYAPIKDKEGKSVAVLATDVKADDFFTITQQTLGPFLLFIFFLSFIITVLTLIVIFSWRHNEKVLEIANRKIESQKKTLEELLKIKDETLHIVNHQINTPISVIRSSMEMFRDGLWDKDKFMGIISSETERMRETIAQFLAAKKAEDGNIKLNKTEVEFVTLVNSILEEKKLLKRVRENNMQLHFESNVADARVNIDIAQIKEVVSNLIDNAIAYSTKDISIYVKKLGNHLQFAVKDSGIGISKENIDKLFNRFTRLENAKKTRPDGTGLGLYVCKQIVEAHEGKIWVESAGEGLGSTFSFEI